MRINPGHKLRRLGSHCMIVGACADNANLTNVFILNDTAAFLWQSVEGRDFDAACLAALLCDNYYVEPAQAAADSEALLGQWLAFGLVRE